MTAAQALATAFLSAAASLAWAQPAPVVRFFELTIAPGQSQAFDAAGKTNIATSIRQEPGTLVMHAFTHTDDPLLAYVFEVYTDTHALQAHATSAHFKRFLADTAHALPSRKLIETEPQLLLEQPTPLAVTAPQRHPHVRLTQITVHETRQADFRLITLWKMAQSMKREKNVLAMYAATVKGQPHQWLLLEIHASEATYQAHRTTAHFRAHQQQSRDMIAQQLLTVMRNSVLMNKGGLSYTTPEPH